jgi:hypothetical protein
MHSTRLPISGSMRSVTRPDRSWPTHAGLHERVPAAGATLSAAAASLLVSPAGSAAAARAAAAPAASTPHIRNRLMTGPVSVLLLAPRGPATGRSAPGGAARAGALGRCGGVAVRPGYRSVDAKPLIRDIPRYLLVATLGVAMLRARGLAGTSPAGSGRRFPQSGSCYAVARGLP